MFDVKNGKVEYLFLAGKDFVCAQMPIEQAQNFDVVESDDLAGYKLKSGNFYFKAKEEDDGRSIKRKRASNNK